jgi:hypothetical protein
MTSSTHWAKVKSVCSRGPAVTEVDSAKTAEVKRYEARMLTTSSGSAMY